MAALLTALVMLVMDIAMALLASALATLAGPDLIVASQSMDHLAPTADPTEFVTHGPDSADASTDTLDPLVPTLEKHAPTLATDTESATLPPVNASAASSGAELVAPRSGPSALEDVLGKESP